MSFYVQRCSDLFMLFCHISCHTLPFVAKHCSKHSEPLGTPSKLIQILGDGNCLFRALPYAVTGRQIYYTLVRVQIINHMNISKHSYLVNGQMTRNKVMVKGIEILSAASLFPLTFLFSPNLGIHTNGN